MEDYKMNIEEKKGYVMIAIAGTLWGSIGYFVNLLGQTGIESSAIAFCRLLFGSIILVPIVLALNGKKGFKIDFKGLLTCIVLGVISQAAFNDMYVKSIQIVGVSTAAVLLYTSPIFVTIMARLIYKEMLSFQKISALILCIGGCFLAVTGGNLSTISFDLKGVIFGLGAAFAYAIMTIICKTFTQKYSPLTIIFYSFLFGALAMFPMIDQQSVVNSLLTAKGFFSAIAIGLFPAAGAYFFYMNGISKGLEASNVSIIASIEIVISILFGVIVFKEPIGFLNIVGIFLFMLSLILLNSAAVTTKLKALKAS